jgi:hypothetical protein
MKSYIIFIFSCLLLVNYISKAQVGIGTVTPTSKLEVKGTGTTAATSAANFTDNNGSSLLYVRDDGNVGIGTTTLNAKLDVNGTINASGAITGLKKMIEALSQTVSASNSGSVYYSQNGGHPAIPENLPDGFSCEIINYSNFANALTTLSTAKYHTKNSGWNSGNGLSSVTITSGGTIRLTAVTISGVKRYFITGDFQ